MLLINNTINIYSLADIIEDKYFRCAEFSYLNENIKIGFLIYTTNENNLILEDYLTYYVNKDSQKKNYFVSLNNLDGYKCFYSQSKRTKNLNSSSRLKKL